MPSREAELIPLRLLDPGRFERASILKTAAAAGRALGELKGIAKSIPNQGILINTLGLQEAKDSSAIENIVTTHDELFREASLPAAQQSPAAKEVLRYVGALRAGFAAVAKSGLLTSNDIIRIQESLELNRAGFRAVLGTALKNQYGETVYTPPEPQLIVGLMTELERFINADETSGIDPLIRMALIHYQFESIHPFYDGNGRTGRIVNVLYLVKQGLLDIPALYMSRHIIRTKSEYYRLLQAVRTDDAWEDWVLYMLQAVEITSREGIATVEAIHDAMQRAKQGIRQRHKKIYSQDLLNLLFSHPYSKIQFVQSELGISRTTATKYLDTLAGDGILAKLRVGRSSYYLNPPLVAILTGMASPGLARSAP